MFGSSDRKRVRPSLKSISFSVAVFVAALYVTIFVGPFGAEVYLPILIAALIAMSISLFRLRGLRAGLPPPYGRGGVTRIDARRTARDGILIIVGTLLSMVALFGSVLVVDPFVLFFPVVFGLMLGLPLSVVIFFGFTAKLESRSKSRIFSITEETAEDGKMVLLKSIELKPILSESRVPTPHVPA